MANVKISDMSAAGVLDGTEVVAGVQVGANVKITTAAIAGLAGGGSAAGPLGTVQMSDGAGAFVVSDFFDKSTPNTVTATLTDATMVGSSTGFEIADGQLSVAPKDGEAGAGVAYFSGVASPASVNIFSANGVRGALTLTGTGNDMGSWFWQGWSGADLVEAARIKVTAQSDFDGTPTSSIDITNASILGVHIAADGTVQLDGGLAMAEGSGTASGGALTLNAPIGRVTSEALVGASSYVLTLTNSFITSPSNVVMVNVTSTDATVLCVMTAKDVTSGQMVVTVKTVTPLTGNLKIDFVIVSDF